jgi:hypothetical protein
MRTHLRETMNRPAVDGRRVPRRREPVLAVSLWMLCWLATGALAQDGLRPRLGAGPPPAPTEQKVFSARVEGTWKKTVEEAREDALENARDRLVAYLRAQNPPLEWAPSPAYLQQHKMIKEDKPTPKEFGDDVGTMYQARLRVEVTAREFEEMARQDRHYRSEQRQVLLLKVLGGLLALLVAVAGYVRLDEWSKGYYTGWLKLAAAVAVAVGLFLLASG